MASSQEFNSAFISYTPQQWMSSHLFPRALKEITERRIETGDVVQGRIFWLPSKEELPERGVKRAHGKGAVEEGIYSHPVVVISRPAEEGHLVHFHLITSLQGKRLDQLYNKSNEFHFSRRSWYLPIAPAPDHPDATSKKTKKRFPTLELANGATLRWDSYVNIRHVYKIDWSLLRPYWHSETPNTQVYRFERESAIRLLAKSKILTMYEPGLQSPNGPDLKRSISEPIRMSTQSSRTIQEGAGKVKSPSSDMTQVASMVYSEESSLPWSTSWRPETKGYRVAGPRPKASPDTETKPVSIDLISEATRQPLGRLIGNVQQVVSHTERRSFGFSVDPSTIVRPVSRFWVDVKGVTAVALASI